MNADQKKTKTNFSSKKYYVITVGDMGILPETVRNLKLNVDPILKDQ